MNKKLKLMGPEAESKINTNLGIHDISKSVFTKTTYIYQLYWRSNDGTDAEMNLYKLYGNKLYEELRIPPKTFFKKLRIRFKLVYIKILDHFCPFHDYDTIYYSSRYKDCILIEEWTN